MESRLRYLNKQLTYAKIITPQDTGKVGMGSTVELQYDDDDETETYTLVGRQEADILQGKHLTRHWAKQLPGSAREILPWLPRRRENIRLRSFPSG